MEYNNPMDIGVLVLAAGRSTRFGSDKRMALMANGKQILYAQLDQVALAGLPAHVCLHPDDASLVVELSGRGISCALYERAKEGMGGTLAQAVTSITQWDGVLVALADMPWIQADTYRSVATGLGVASICVPTQNDRRGHPVGFANRHFEELSGISGPMGARKVVENNSCDVYELVVEDSGIHWDIDVPDDLTRARFE